MPLLGRFVACLTPKAICATWLRLCLTSLSSETCQLDSAPPPRRVYRCFFTAKSETTSAESAVAVLRAGWNSCLGVGRELPSPHSPLVLPAEMEPDLALSWILVLKGSVTKAGSFLPPLLAWGAPLH